MKFFYFLEIFFVCFNLIMTNNYSQITRFPGRKKITKVKSFIKRINNTSFFCYNFNFIEKNFICLKNGIIYAIDDSGKILLKAELFDFAKNLSQIKNNSYLLPNKIPSYKNINSNFSFNKIKDESKKNFYLLKRELNEDLVKCSKSDNISLKNSLCIECNTEKGYYPIISNYNHMAKYKECHLYQKDSEINLIGYYFDSQEKAYKKCHSNCLTCTQSGNDLINNCISCNLGYIKPQEIDSTTNCVKKCDYFYFYSLTGDYICTQDFYCPNEAKNLIKEKNKCIDDCSKDDFFKKPYNGECYNLCPINTVFDLDMNICKDIDTNLCILTEKEIKINIINFNRNIIDIYVKNYVDEFFYNENHVSLFLSQNNFSFIIYRNNTCLNELKVNSSKINFEKCINKINETYKIQKPIIVIIDFKGKYGYPMTTFAFYDPKDGSKLNTSFCDKDSFVIYKNITSLYQKDKYDWLVKQGVDIFNINSSYYLSNCFEFKDNNKKDLLLKDRLLNFYPAISICDIKCTYKKTNYISLITECICLYDENKFNSFNYLSIFILEESIKAIHDLFLNGTALYLIYYETMKISFLKCYKNVFKFKFFIRNFGGYITLILLIIDGACVTLLIKDNFFNKIKSFILIITDLYINYSKKKKKGKRKELIYDDNNLIKKEKEENENNYLNIFPKEKNKLVNKNENKNKNLNKQTLISSDEISNHITHNNSTKKIILKKSENAGNKNNKNESKLKSVINILNHQSILEKLNIDEKTIEIRENNLSIDKISELDMKNYLTLSPDEMDYYESLDKDKRSFASMLLNLIIRKNIIIETFFIKEETEPLYIKIIELAFFLSVNLVSCALLFLNEDIIMLYDMSLAKYLSKIWYINSLICFAVIINLRKYMKLILINKDSIREIIKREKKNKNILKIEMIKFVKYIKFRYVIFLILNFIFILASFYYISTFNNAYPNLKKVLIVIFIIVILLIQLLYAILAIISVCLRYIAIKNKFNFIFVLSQYLYDLL